MKGAEQPDEDGEEEHNAKVQIEDEAELRQAAEILGLSTIKYGDLKRDRKENYKFSYDQMLDPRGDTGVYLLYAYVRVCSILRKAGYEENTADQYQFSISDPSERALALTLIRLPEAVEAAAKDLKVNRVCDLIYDISQRLSTFYSQVKVLGSAEQKSRMGLLLATKKIMKLCFNLLGMRTIERI